MANDAQLRGEVFGRHGAAAVMGEEKEEGLSLASSLLHLEDHHSSLVKSATRLLLDNYRVDLEATTPSPLIDAHQVNKSTG